MHPFVFWVVYTEQAFRVNYRLRFRPFVVRLLPPPVPRCCAAKAASSARVSNMGRAPDTMCDRMTRVSSTRWADGTHER